MIKRLQFKMPSRAAVGKLAWAGCVIGAGVLAFFWGRHAALSQAPPSAVTAKVTPPPAFPVMQQDASTYNQRVVGYVNYGGQQIPITREELGEYLITRLGADRLEYLINRKIIEMACFQHGVRVSDEEIAKQYAEDLKGFNVSEKDFVNVLLKRRGQSLFEWKEDVIRPRLAMNTLCAKGVQVTEEDIQKGFEAQFGDKVECRMIVLSKEQGRNGSDIWAKVQASEAEFDKWAKQSCIPEIAARAGKVPPIHRFFPDKNIETHAFKLKPGELSPLLAMPDDGTTIILRCEKLIPRDNTRTIEQERLKLRDDIFQAKLAQEVPRVFHELRTLAAPKNFLRPEPTATALERSAPSSQLKGAPGPTIQQGN